MKTFLARFAQNESGATAIEYGLIAAFIGVGIIAGLTQLKGGLNAPVRRTSTRSWATSVSHTRRLLEGAARRTPRRAALRLAAIPSASALQPLRLRLV